ncbi:13260_t:CDS:2 [Funneliformis mosseae]|uniref:13260_t:CDS:1 n=1 Tax=Funneliformis mosseae TaxID=27381 RepID=A0A9N9BHS7_FUNMO|nr:13260_t:CDS:2 [Funneliformis mosseae]
MDIYTSLSSISTSFFFPIIFVRKLDNYLLNGNHITIFAPTNDVINRQLQYHERQYSIGECGGGLDDLDLFVKHHLNDEVLCSKNLALEIQMGEPIKVEKDKLGNIRVCRWKCPLKVIHVINNIAIPNALHFTKHKYLCTPYTILAPKDEYFDDNLISIGKVTLIYHVLEGKYVTSDLFNNMHIKTELRTKDLKIIDKELLFPYYKNVDLPVEIGNAIIYVLTGELNPPPPIMRTLGSDEQYKSINFFVNHGNLISKVRSTKGFTMIAPKKLS